jgi:site-specific recombinase XerC
VLLGHASLSSTQIYLGLETSDLARMLEKSHPRGRGDRT